MDHERFPTMNETIDIIHRRGFKIALTVQPFIATESSNFAAAVQNGLLVKHITASYIISLTIIPTGVKIILLLYDQSGWGIDDALGV